MSLETVRQTALPVMALIVVIVALGIAIFLESEVLLSVVVILPFLLGIVLAQNHHLQLTRQCLASYLQMCKPLKR